MELTVVRDPTPEQISIFADLRFAQHQQTFIAEGEKVVMRLLESEFEIDSLYMTPEHFADKRTAIERHQQNSNPQVFLAAKKEMEKIVGFPLHQGVLASARIPRQISVEALVEHSERPLLFVLLDEIADAENIGAIYRTALAMGATAIVLDDKSVNPWSRRSVRVSMGAMFHLPTVIAESVLDAATLLRTKGVRTFAATIGPRAKPVWDVELAADVALVFGSEGYGVKRAIVEACEAEVSIPMLQGVDSLNVAVAQGAILYEVLRQRKRKASGGSDRG